MSIGSTAPSTLPRQQPHISPAVEVPFTSLEDRYVSASERSGARRLGASGKLGSQKTTRFVFNAAVQKQAGVAGGTVDLPISRSKSH